MIITHKQTPDGDYFSEGIYTLPNGKRSCARLAGHLTPDEFMYVLLRMRKKIKTQPEER